MNLFSEAEAYISTHAKNIGTDVIQHLKAFAASVDAKAKTVVAEAEPEAQKIEADVKADVTEAVSYVETKVDDVKLAAEALAQHAEGSFAKLLASESTPATSTPESK